MQIRVSGTEPFNYLMYTKVYLKNGESALELGSLDIKMLDEILKANQMYSYCCLDDEFEFCQLGDW